MPSETWKTNGNGAAGPSGYVPSGTATQSLALDNLIRRELRVTDPNDPDAVAKALTARYKDDPRTVSIEQEALGLPFALAQGAPAQLAPAASSSDAELAEALDDVRRDLEELTTNAQLKDVKPELVGWQRALESLMTEGTTSARTAADPRQRDKTFAIRRQLGEYARVARLLGVLSPPLGPTYRSFAQSLDELASVFLVMMGESLSNTTSSGGRFLMQVPFTELQSRRDAVIAALRNLTGSVQQAYGPGEWAWGLDSYATLVHQLEAHGQGDLRMLLEEGELSRVMDELIRRAAHGSSEGLRALGATAQLDLERFRRMTAVGQRLVQKRSPAFTSYLETLQLFADAFNPSGGHRLVRVARPPILFYGLYGDSGREQAERRLVELLVYRGQLASLLDRYTECGCNLSTLIRLALTDSALYDVDRAIDLYAFGTQDRGLPEQRAAASALFIDAVLFSAQAKAARAARAARALGAGDGDDGPLLNLGKLTDEVLARIRDLLFGVLVEDDGPEAPPPGEPLPGKVPLPAAFRDLARQELSIQRSLELRWLDLAKTMAPDAYTLAELSKAFTDAFDYALSIIARDVDHTSFDVRFPVTVEEGMERLATRFHDVATAVREGTRGIAKQIHRKNQDEEADFVDAGGLERARAESAEAVARWADDAAGLVDHLRAGADEKRRRVGLLHARREHWLGQIKAAGSVAGVLSGVRAFTAEAFEIAKGGAAPGGEGSGA